MSLWVSKATFEEGPLVGAKRTTNGKSPSDCEKDDRAAKGAVALRGHSERQLLAPSRYPEVDIPCDERSIATLVGSSSAAIFCTSVWTGRRTWLRAYPSAKAPRRGCRRAACGFDGG